MDNSILNYITWPAFLMFIGGLATIGFGLLTRDKKEVPQWISWCTVAGGIVTIIGGAWGSVNQSSFQNKIGNQSRELVSKSKEIESLQKNLSSILTGGNSFAYADISIAKDPKEDYLQFNVIHKGEFPIYDLEVKITDQDHSRELLHEAKLKGLPLTLQYFDQAKKTMSFGTLGPGKMISGCAAYLMPSDLLDRNFLIEIESRYDRLMQNIHVHRNPDGRLSLDNKVTRGEKVIHSSGDIQYFERRIGDDAAPNTGDSGYPSIPVAIITGIPGYRWTLRDQGESLSLMALDGQWYAFDAKGKLIEPEILK